MRHTSSVVSVLAVSAASLVMAACGLLLDPDPWTERQSQLEFHRQVWETVGPDSYRYDLTRACFCALAGDFTVVVNEGAVVQATRPDGSTVPEESLPYLQTVGDLFDRIQMAIENEADRFEARYDPDLGYPTLVDLDPQLNTIDEEIRYEASSLEPTS